MDQNSIPWENWLFSPFFCSFNTWRRLLCRHGNCLIPNYAVRLPGGLFLNGGVHPSRTWAPVPIAWPTTPQVQPGPNFHLLLSEIWPVWFREGRRNVCERERKDPGVIKGCGPSDFFMSQTCQVRYRFLRPLWVLLYDWRKTDILW